MSSVVLATESPAGHDLSVLAQAEGLWRHWCFEPWTLDAMAGLSRRATFTKNALLGEVARYYADDYIVWTHEGEADCRRVFETWKPAPDVMLHRFLFVTDAVVRPVRRRSFLLGLRGYLEVYQWAIGAQGPRALRDLSELVNQGWQIVREHGEVR